METKWLEADLEGGGEAVPLFTLQGNASQPPILVSMTVGETPVQFDLDTGAAVTGHDQLQLPQ